MKSEIESATAFISNFLKGLSGEQVLKFKASLGEVLTSHYTDHWFPEKPYRGSAYRCMRVNQKRMDPLLLSAGNQAGLTESLLLQHLPSEFTIWVDPDEVSYRFGEDGSIGVIFEGQDSSTQTTVESQSLMQGLYDSCKKQVHGLLHSTVSRGSDLPVSLDCWRSIIMV